MSIKAEHISKYYRLGELNTRSFLQDVVRKMTGKSAQFAVNDRTQQGGDFVWALKDIGFEISTGEVVGVIGKNGAGKSTLLKILSRVTAPSEGRISMKGRVGSLLEVGTGFHPDLTGRENIYLNGSILGMTKRDIKRRFDEIVQFSGVQKYLDTPIKRYSSGMTVRLAFAVAAHLEPEILIVDEVLAVGDAEFQEKCVGKMKDVSGEGRTVLFVSHNMGTIRQLCNRGILLEKGSVSFDGSVEAAVEMYMKHQQKAGLDGEISASMGTGAKEVAMIKKVQLGSYTSMPANTIPYQSPIPLHIQFEGKQALEKALIGIQIKSMFNEWVSDFVNVYDQQEVAIDKGINTWEIKLRNQLLPGKYFIHLTLARYNGVPEHSLEGIIEFQVDANALDPQNNYPFGWTNGYLRGEAQWSKK